MVPTAKKPFDRDAKVPSTVQAMRPALRDGKSSMAAVWIFAKGTETVLRFTRRRRAGDGAAHGQTGEHAEERELGVGDRFGPVGLEERHPPEGDAQGSASDDRAMEVVKEAVAADLFLVRGDVPAAQDVNVALRGVDLEERRLEIELAVLSRRVESRLPDGARAPGAGEGDKDRETPAREAGVAMHAISPGRGGARVSLSLEQEG
jgi:hypothetical protein